MASIALSGHSLKTKITLSTLAIFLAGLWSLSYYASQMLRADMERLLGEQQLSTVSLVASEVNRDLTDRLKVLESVASSSRQAMQRGPRAMQDMLDQHPVLQTLFNGGIIAYGLDGARVADYPMSAQGSQVSQRHIHLVSAALREGKSSIGLPLPSQQLKAPIFGIAVPIRNPAGQVIGALVGVINLGIPNFLQELTQSRYGQSGYYLLEDPKTRLIITGSDRRRVMQPLPAPGVNALIDRHVAGFDESGVTVNPMGVEVLASAARVPVTGWFMLAALPTAEAFSPIRDMQQRMWLATALLTLLAGGLTWWLLRRQLSPMLTAAAALATMADTRQPMRPLPVTSQDEISHLIGGFNRLLGDLGQRETLLKQILDTSSVAIFLIDRDGRISQANQRMAEMFGCSLDTLVGSDYVALIHPSERETGRLNMQALLAGAIPSTDTDRLYWRADHSEFWSHLTGKRFFDAGGELHGIIGVIADITERKRIEEALRTSEQRFRDMVNTTDGIVWEADAATFTFTFVSEQAERLLGFPAADWLQPGFWVEHLHPEDQTWAPEYCAACTGRLESHDFEYRFIASDGRSVWLRDMVTVVAEHGQPRCLRGLMVDISKNKQMDASLRVAATAFESQEAMTITDANKVILKINQAFTRVTGYSEAEAIGQTPALLKSGRQDNAFYQAMWDSLNHKRYWQGEIWNRRKSGEIYPERLSISAVLDEKGAVTNYVASFSDITLSKRAQDEIQQLAFTDPLTGLPNRRLLMDRLKHALATSARNKREGALLFIDLDNFKTLNDTLGHDIGDLLLQQVTQRLINCVREGDTVARLGGDEFVVMLEDLSENAQEAAMHAESVGEKILASLNQIYRLAGYEHHSSASIGLTLFGNKRETVDDLLKRADLAMYSSKTAGRNTLRFFDPEMQIVVSTRAAMESDLREAVVKDQFHLHYQVQVSGSGRFTGAEVLVRWQHPQRGMVSPAEFIPVAEETGLILPLGKWVLEAACQQLADWALRPEMAHLTVAVNVSARQFHHRDFVDQVVGVLARTGANPQRLKLELTESMLVSNVNDIIAKMSALKSRGVGFSLDDFGTGYSSLTYLKRLPLDQLKIDQGFVRDILIDPNDAAIARTIVALAESLGLAVIAEGVETEAQRAALARQGCHAYQGYLFSRPLPLKQFETFMGQLDMDVVTPLA
jgi:diguanylate cyclase (GGDEF)-like protein/PAS domain S-box-containing protein